MPPNYSPTTKYQQQNVINNINNNSDKKILNINSLPSRSISPKWKIVNKKVSPILKNSGIFDICKTSKNYKNFEEKTKILPQHSSFNISDHYVNDFKSSENYSESSRVSEFSMSNSNQSFRIPNSNFFCITDLIIPLDNSHLNSKRMFQPKSIMTKKTPIIDSMSDSASNNAAVRQMDLELKRLREAPLQVEKKIYYKNIIIIFF